MNPIVEHDAALIQGRQDCYEALFNLQDKKILITGILGLVGSYLADLFAKLKVGEITGVDNGVAPSRAWSPDSPYYRHNITEYDWGGKIKFDVIFHCASIASPKIYKRSPFTTIEVNTKGTQKMLELAERTGALMIHFSSSEVYGDPIVVPTPEAYNGNVIMHGPRACYDESKRLSEVLCWLYAQRGVKVRIVRPFNLMGPGYSLKDGRVIPALMNSALNDEPFYIYGDGSATRTFCYLSDAFVQLLGVIENGKDGEVYNVGNDRDEVSVFELANTMKALCPNVKVVHKMEVNDSTQPHRRCPDINKVTRIAPRPTVSLSDGLWRTYRSYK